MSEYNGEKLVKKVADLKSNDLPVYINIEGKIFKLSSVMKDGVSCNGEEISAIVLNGEK